MRRSSVIVAPLLAGLALYACASAGARKFPVPSCSWVSAAAVSRAVGEPVRARPGYWRTEHAPVLTCPYQERSPNLQLGNLPLVSVQFSELQAYHVVRGELQVRGLGRCVRSDTCPLPGKPAWLFTTENKATRATAPYVFRYVDNEALFVEDGADAIGIAIENPNGPVHVKNETAQLEKLVRGLMQRFYWA